jgi:hypothetical protein
MKTTATRFWHLMAMAPAVLLLTGAKAEGCWGEVDVPDPPVVCQAGTHLETICDDDVVPPEPCGPDTFCAQSVKADDEDGASCHDECVPDSVCGDGFVEQVQCAPVGPDYCEDTPCDCPPDSECVCAQSYCEPAEEECWIECVPACPEGSHAETVCGEPILQGEEPQCAYDGVKGGCLEPPEECTMQCVPDSICPPGYEEVGVCELCAAVEGQPCDDMCWTECWPVDPTCPPGCFEEMICEDCAEGEDCGGCYSTCACGGEEPSTPPSEPKD